MCVGAKLSGRWKLGRDVVDTRNDLAGVISQEPGGCAVAGLGVSAVDNSVPRKSSILRVALLVLKTGDKPPAPTLFLNRMPFFIGQ